MKGLIEFVAATMHIIEMCGTLILALVGWYNLYYRFRPFTNEQDDRWLAAIKMLATNPEVEKGKVDFERLDRLIARRVSGWSREDTRDLLSLCNSRGIIRWNQEVETAVFVRFMWPLLKPKVQELWRRLQWRHNIPTAAAED